MVDNNATYTCTNFNPFRIRMNYLSIIIALYLCFCNQKAIAATNWINECYPTSGYFIENNTDDTLKKRINEAMLVEDILFNGKLKRFFTLSDFERVFGKADSTKLMLEEEPCSYIFDNPDGSKDATDRYFYKDGSRFESSGNKMAVDELLFQNGNFITYKGTVINAASTIEDIEQLFPNAVKNIGTFDVYGEGKLQVIQLREDEEGISDGHINLFFKNNKVYYIHWWFPC